MREYLGQVIFDFAKANRLEGDEHTAAFVDLFAAVLRFALELCGEVTMLEIRSKHPITPTGVSSEQRSGREYRSTVPVETVRGAEARLGREMYFSRNSESRIMIGEETELFVATDPVYFRLTAKGHRRD